MMKCFQTLAVFTAVFLSGAHADDDHPYYCTSDAYCEKTTPARPASPSTTTATWSPSVPQTRRSAQPAVERNLGCVRRTRAQYLNAHCVFVSEENLSLSSSGSGSSRRLASSSNSTSTAASSESSSASSSTTSTSSSSETSSGSAGSSSSNSSSSDADALYTATIDGEEQAADPSTCYPSACGSSDSKEQCTYQGICTYKSKKKITKRTCMCYAGFEGDMCSTEVSNACDVDCGTGGDCVDGECVCKEGFDGKEYDGKQGKANQRCTLCTNDLACQYNNTCNTDTGKCVRAAGYSGDTCGAVEDACTTTSCGEGDCQVLTNGSAACYCPSCSPSCALCDMLSNYTFDCSTCVTDGATATQASKLLKLASGLVAVLLANFAL
ncbi:hypothetical protein V7S43_007052 [Phytophthora oleae]|uniref:EGF-like domain-containing protein n=1 Tax=Phytophthora oleae TaxID=2107226 RepID=A0ABD3FMQ7_9STRA